MSTTPPPDRPTERLQPNPPPPPLYEERVVTPGIDPNAILLRLEGAIGSLRTGLVVVGVIAVAALGVAVYALMKADDESSKSRSGLASDARVSQLDDRIDRVSRQVQAVRSAGGTSSKALDDRVAAIEKTARTLAQRPSTDPQQAIDQLSKRIDAITQDVEALKQVQPAP